MYLILSPNQVSLAAALLAVAYGLVDQALPGLGRDALAGALSGFLIGLLIMITAGRPLQIVGLIRWKTASICWGVVDDARIAADH